jgi:hypothetical protein
MTFVDIELAPNRSFFEFLSADGLNGQRAHPVNNSLGVRALDVWK